MFVPQVNPLYHVYAMNTTTINLMVRTIFQIPLFTLTQVAGGTAITLPQFEPKSFLAALERWRPTVLQLPPPLISFLADHPSVADFPNVVCSFSFVMEHKLKSQADKLSRVIN